ncbi:MAG: hypothetical protein ACXWCG_05305, partial [Flavitalea sp.]
FHKRFSKKEIPQRREYHYSRFYTFLWGVFCIVIAQFATSIGNSLIEAVNVLGSLFYGVILGIFLVAFYLKSISGRVVFISALIVQAYIILSFLWPWFTGQIPALSGLPPVIKSIMSSASTIGFLWLNGIGALGVVLLCIIFQPLLKNNMVVK